MNKEEEKYYLELFKELYMNFPKGNIIVTESPDFIIDDSEKKYGIELSSIFQNSKVSGVKAQAADSIGESVTNLVSERLSSLDISYLDVFIIFSFQKHLIKKERENFSNKIVDLILSNIPKSNCWIRLENDFDNEMVFPWEITSVRIYNLPQLLKSHVNFPRSGWVQEDMIEELQDTINKKNSKLNTAIKSYDENWLLIHTVNFSSASFFEPSQITLSNKYESNFDKIFYLDSSNHKCFELEIIRQANQRLSPTASPNRS